MSLKNRFLCFGACYLIGILITFLSIISLVNIKSKPYQFAILYTLGNILSIAATAFLWDPIHQVQNMFKRPRVYSSVIYFSCMILTIIVVCTSTKHKIIYLLVFIQFLAGIWFTLAAIPYFQSLVCRLVPI